MPSSIPLPPLTALPAFVAAELASVQAAFATAPILPFLQGWQEHFDGLPATAQLGWREGRLWALGTLTDRDVFNTATADNQNTWELGDVFEVFVGVGEAQSYVEAHVTPNGIRLHLAFPDRATIARARSGALDGATLQRDPEQLVGHAWRTETGWIGLLGVPVAVEPGTVLRVSVCRYDAHPNHEPDVSSTSHHTTCDFHRPDDWPAYTVPPSSED